MTVGDAVAACEYCGCDIVDFNGEKIEVTKENCSVLYKQTVEHLSAWNDRVLIWTFINEPDFINAD